MKSTYTWLVVHGRYVNLEGSNVGQQEGQSPPVEHLRGRNITGVHLAIPLSHHGNIIRDNWKIIRADLYLYDFIKESLWSLLKVKLEVLKEQKKNCDDSTAVYCVLFSSPLHCTSL